MKLLTIDNAREILEKGETYRIGTNALNVLEFTYEHLNGLINWLDMEMEEQKTDFRFHALKKPNAEDKRFEWGVFCAWNGEPLWILDDYETTDEIMQRRENEIMLPDY